MGALCVATSLGVKYLGRDMFIFLLRYRGNPPTWCVILIKEQQGAPIRVHSAMEDRDEAALAKAAAIDLLKSYLNKRMRVAISDGRVIDGNFLCTDRDSNIVLGNCEEFSSQEELGVCTCVCVCQSTSIRPTLCS